MQTFDYAGQILQALKLDLDRKVKRDGDGYAFRCILPGHPDKNPSAWILDRAWGCHKCGQQVLTTLGDHYGVPRPKPKNGLTVEDYAEGKGFSLDKLRSWGVTTGTGKYGQDVVYLPYYAADGVTVLRRRIRTYKSVFWEGSGLPVYLYGINVVAKSDPKKPVLIVEGESDCHAAWHGGVLAVGVPGNNAWKPEWAELIGDRPVYVWQEPESGVKLTEAVVASFPNARIIIATDEAKDVADLFKLAGSTSRFKTLLADRLSSALNPGQKSATVPFAAALGPSLAQLRIEKQRPVDSVPTPFKIWNEACMGAGGQSGLARGWHTTLAANTGFGKSLIALNLAAMAMWKGETVTFISLEMSPEELVTRLLSIVSGEPGRSLNQGPWFDLASFDRACAAMHKIHEQTGGSVHFNKCSISELGQVVSGMREQVEYAGSRYVIVDYLQLANVPGIEHLTERITKVSNEIRRTAKELRIVSVGVSQYNRETSKDRENPPIVQGLMGGSALENDSDQVLLLDHTSYKKDDLQHSANATLILAKNRHGPQAKIPLTFNYRDLSITETVPVVMPDRAERYEKSEIDDSEGGDVSFDPPILAIL